MPKRDIQMPEEFRTDIEKLNQRSGEKVTPKLILTETGAVRKLLANLSAIIGSSEYMQGLGYNDFTHEITIRGEPVDDRLIDQIRLMVDKRFLLTFTRDDVLTVLEQLAREANAYHPVKIMIERQPWDGIPRAETIFTDYLGAEDNTYTRNVARKWLTGAVARIYQPGVKFELVPILQGKQGRGKSTLASKLGGPYFLDTLKTLGKTKDDYQLLIGAWIVELGELSSLNATETESTKNFISATSDKIRLPYARITSQFKRTCVFIGTTNAAEYLTDLTGNRRFFPIPLEDEPAKDVFSLDADTVQQIWAEAYHFYQAGENFYSDACLEGLADEYRKQATEEDMIFSDMEAFLEMPVPSNWDSLKLWEKRGIFTRYTQQGKAEPNGQPLNKTTANEIARVCFKLEADNRRSKSILTKIDLYMANLNGWKKQRVWINGKSQRGYKKSI